MNNLWRNFCVSDAFEPGSTAKPFTLATGLETGTLTGQETYVCQGGTWKGDWYIQCHNTSGHGTENVDQAIANSCNVALMAMADKIGVEDLSGISISLGLESTRELTCRERRPQKI